MQSVKTTLETVGSLQSATCLLLVLWKLKRSYMLWAATLAAMLISKSSVKGSIFRWDFSS